MKRTLLLATLLLGFYAGAFAQVPKLTLGLKTGINIAKLNTDWASSDNRLGYQAGVWARIGAAGFYVQPEAYVGSKGGEIKGSEGTAKVDFTTLDVPILLGNKFGVDKLNVHFMAGPVISFILKDDFKSNFQNVTAVSDYKNQTIGGQAGAGVDIGNISLDLRYEMGLSNINKSSQYDQKQNLWHISIGYKLF